MAYTGDIASVAGVVALCEKQIYVVPMGSKKKKEGE